MTEGAKKMIYTPGPWVADRVHPEWPAVDVRYVEAPGLCDELCTLYGPDADTATANARLIAAAPDLLAALENLVQACIADGWADHGYWADEASTAIKKARGE